MNRPVEPAPCPAVVASRSSVSTRSIRTSAVDTSCDICGRTLLRGERADVYLHGGTRHGNLRRLCARDGRFTPVGSARGRCPPTTGPALVAIAVARCSAGCAAGVTWSRNRSTTSSTRNSTRPSRGQGQAPVDWPDAGGRGGSERRPAPGAGAAAPVVTRQRRGNPAHGSRAMCGQSRPAPRTRPPRPCRCSTI